jgi:hypothetical protein
VRKCQLDSRGVGQEMVKGSCKHSNEPLVFTRGKTFLDYLSNYRLQGLWPMELVIWLVGEGIWLSYTFIWAHHFHKVRTSIKITINTLNYAKKFTGNASCLTYIKEIWIDTNQTEQGFTILFQDYHSNRFSVSLCPATGSFLCQQ